MCALAISPQALSACILNDLSLTDHLQVQGPPHLETIMFLTGASTKLLPAILYVSGHAVDDGLLELSSKVNSFLGKGGHNFTLKTGNR